MLHHRLYLGVFDGELSLRANVVLGENRFAGAVHAPCGCGLACGFEPVALAILELLGDGAHPRFHLGVLVCLELAHLLEEHRPAGRALVVRHDYLVNAAAALEVGEPVVTEGIPRLRVHRRSRTELMVADVLLRRPRSSERARLRRLLVHRIVAVGIHRLTQRSGLVVDAARSPQGV